MILPGLCDERDTGDLWGKHFFQESAKEKEEPHDEQIKVAGSDCLSSCRGFRLDHNKCQVNKLLVKEFLQWQSETIFPLVAWLRR